MRSLSSGSRTHTRHDARALRCLDLSQHGSLVGALAALSFTYFLTCVGVLASLAAHEEFDKLDKDVSGELDLAEVHEFFKEIQIGNIMRNRKDEL